MLFSSTSFIFAISAFVSAVSAAPTKLHERTLPPILIPTGVTPPTNTELVHVFLGYGTQNYTCNATAGTFLTTGTAEAVLLDLSEFYLDPNCPITAIPPVNELQSVGRHYYVPNPLSTNTTAPKFEMQTGSKSFIISSKNASVASADPTYSVASVLLHNIQSGQAGGNLADWVVRTNVVGGVVPTILNTCKAGDAIAIPYKANYLFYKNK